MLTKRQTMPITKIIEEYKNGRRDFSNIMCSGVNFNNVKLPGCNFTNSDLSFNQFEKADLSNCNFTSAVLEWSGFNGADLRNSNFTKANMSYSSFKKAKMDGVILEKTDVSWCFIFDTNLDRLQHKTADFTMTAFHPSEVTEEGRLAVKHKLMERKGALDFETFHRIEFIIKADDETLKKVNVAENAKSHYAKGHVTYGGVNAGNYSTAPATQHGSYAEGPANYTAKRKKKDLYKD